MRMVTAHLRTTILGLVLTFGGLSGILLYGTGSAGPSIADAAPEHHPHIRRALHEMREARRELKEAAHDFGGHRAEALRALDVAIAQLDKSLKFDKR